MFARNVHLQLKPDTATQFTQTVEKEVIPLLRKQAGFKDEIAFIVPGGKEAYSISFWESKEKADAYNRTGYQDVLKTLSKVIEGTPELQGCEVTNSTMHKIPGRA
jgi:heme-degrading monooxygenase HmoA